MAIVILLASFDVGSIIGLPLLLHYLSKIPCREKLGCNFNYNLDFFFEFTMIVWVRGWFVVSKHFLLSFSTIDKIQSISLENLISSLLFFPLYRKFSSSIKKINFIGIFIYTVSLSCHFFELLRNSSPIGRQIRTLMIE